MIGFKLDRKTKSLWKSYCKIGNLAWHKSVLKVCISIVSFANTRRDQNSFIPKFTCCIALTDQYNNTLTWNQITQMKQGMLKFQWTVHEERECTYIKKSLDFLPFLKVNCVNFKIKKRVMYFFFQNNISLITVQHNKTFKQKREKKYYVA